MKFCIEVDRISKKFKMYQSQRARLSEILSGGLIQKHQEKWVLKDVSFNVSPGESLALVGQNGSGKSTLLSIIVGSRASTSGKVRLQGSVSALLELGMGFNADFTGRENAVMGLQLLGLQGATIAEYLPGIVGFSELGEYFEHPLRTYSTGMQVRLAFSVATAIKPDILIVDEALSVGDVYFQHKSMGRIRELKEQGTSLLFVSHDAAAVKSLCDRAILLDQGVVLKDDVPDRVMDYYNAMIAEKERHWDIQQSETGQTRSGSGVISFHSIELLNQNNEKRETLRVGELATIRCHLDAKEDLPMPTIGLSVRDRIGNEVFGTNTHHLGSTAGLRLSKGRSYIDFELCFNIGPGSYSITVAAHTHDTHLENNYDWWDQACVFQVVPGNEYQFQGTAFLDVKVRHGQ